jgi:hypothetical protein
MNVPAMPLKLGGRGPFVTLNVTSLAGPVIFRGRLPAQICFFLEDGAELRLPMSSEMIRTLAFRLRQFADDHK